MSAFNPNDLRVLRKARNITAAEMAKRMGLSPAQIHRLEMGTRRLTIDALIAYCQALAISPGHFFTPNLWVPVTGVIDSDFEIQPLPPISENRTLAPPLNPDMSQVAALRWAASRRFQPMFDHIVFYKRHDYGVPDQAWDKRSLIVREDGSQCLGWPKRSGNSAHIDFGDGPVEFDVAISWASPVLAVLPPHAIEELVPPDL